MEGLDRPVRVALVDDHDLVRTGLKAVLKGAAGIEVVGEARNGREAIGLCGRVRPDIMLMDVRMPEMDGLKATREIKKRWPLVGVLILTVHENQDYMLEALKAGAAGYILKDAPQDQLVGAIRRVLEGEATLDHRLATQLLQRLAAEEPSAEEPLPVGTGL
jgi:DNA-binding NarL/FixJ family response regulator